MCARPDDTAQRHPPSKRRCPPNLARLSLGANEGGAGISSGAKVARRKGQLQTERRASEGKKIWAVDVLVDVCNGCL